MLEDFGNFGDEFLIGDCRDDWDLGRDDLLEWETEQVFQDGVLDRQEEYGESEESREIEED